MVMLFEQLIHTSNVRSYSTFGVIKLYNHPSKKKTPEVIILEQSTSS